VDVVDRMLTVLSRFRLVLFARFRNVNRSWRFRKRVFLVVCGLWRQ
jgi:hypothetical protein